MPFKSEAQRKFMYKNHPEIAERWSKEEGSGGELPKRIHPKKKGMQRIQRVFKRN